MTAVLFVCLGNICRSPLAEGVMRHQAQAAAVAHRFTLDSAGCSGSHTGEAPDPRSIAVAGCYDIDLTTQSARQVVADDFSRFDLILGLDRDNVRHLNRIRPQGSTAQVALYLDAALRLTKDVPDPYYGSPRDFETVYRLCAEASAALIQKLT